MENKLSICFIDTLGLKYTGDTTEKRGIGGSESAIIYLGREFVKLGLEVTVYCACESEGIYNGVEYKNIKDIDKETKSFDILISSRSVLPFIPQDFAERIEKNHGKDINPFKDIVKNAKFRAVWMHDTFLEGEEWIEPLLVDGLVNELFLLSDWHSHYISQSDHFGTPKRRYEQLKHKIFETRNGVNTYIEEIDINTKDPNLFVYNASISKGMRPLLKLIWEHIKANIPEAELIIIGGYYTNLQKDGAIDASEQEFNELVKEYEGKNGIHFTGVITQKEIASILSKATYFIYPPDFPETYGISTLEAINCNVLPITSRFGALEEVAMSNVSYLMDYEIYHDNNQVNRFVNLVINSYNDSYLKQQKQYACNEIKPYISWESVALQWKQHFYNHYGIPMDRKEREHVRDIATNVNRIFKRRNINPEDKFEHFNSHTERQIAIISPVYNAEKYIDKCIKSVASQLYDNYIHIIVDDMSTDNTVKIAQETIEKLPSELVGKFIIVENTEKYNALTNQIIACNQIDNNEAIIVLLDGDDWLKNDPDIFRFINEQYHNGAKMTYGSCHSLVDNINLIAQPYPEHIKENKEYRNYLFNWGIPYTHLRTFEKSLLNKIDDTLLKDENGNYFGAGGDGALLYALLEVCNPNEIKCIQRILVEYNDLNSLNDYKVNGEEQTRNQLKIRDMLKYPSKKENMVETLQEVHQDVINKKPEAIEVYKEAIANRSDTWIDNTDVENIKIRQDWLIHKFKELNISKKSKILDVGSWSGNFINTFYKMGYENITCLDISTETVKLGKETFPYFNWICDDIEKYDTYERYDVIVIFEVLEHLVYPLNVINKLKGLLTATGKIFLTIPTEDIVFENGKNCEHISKIEEEPISIICDYYDIIESSNCKWYAGYLAKYKNKEERPIEKRILIATPTAKYMEMETFSSIFNLSKPRNMEVDFQYFYGYNIAQVRNLIANYAIENKYDYVLWVDSDIVLPKDALLKMLNYQKDMITGVYIQRFPDKKVPEIYVLNNNNISNAKLEDVMENKVMEIAGCGFGCVLTTVSMLKNIGYPQFEYHNALDHKDTLSEDVDFCIKAMRKNYKMYVDTSIKCEHIGATKFVV